MDLSSSSTTQSGHHLQTVQTTAEGTSFSGSMNTMALCDLVCGALEEHLLTYLLNEKLSQAQSSPYCVVKEPDVKQNMTQSLHSAM